MEDAKYHRKQQVYNSFRLYSATFVWLFFTFINFLVFFDGGCIFALLPEVRESPTINGVEGTSSTHLNMSSFKNSSSSRSVAVALSTTKAGIFAAIFMAGFAAGTPCAALILSSGVVSSNKLILFGMIGWTLSVAVVGCAVNYWMLISGRFLVGVSEAFFSPLLTVVVDNIAPREKKVRWLSLLYAMMPVGMAVGMICGGQLGKLRLDGHAGWRLFMLIEVPLGVVSCLLLIGVPDVYNIYGAKEKHHQQNSKNEQEEEEEEPVGALGIPSPRVNNNNNNSSSDNDDDQQQAADDLQDEHVPYCTAVTALLCNNASFLALSLGYAMYDFMISAFCAFIVIMLVQGPYNDGNGVDAGLASNILGGVIAGASMCGTVLGGTIVDCFGGVLGYNGISRCVLFSLCCVTTGFALGIGGVLQTELANFLCFFVPSVLCLTMSTAGLVVAILHVVPRNLRAYAQSTNVLLMNILGDMVSPALVGTVSAHFDADCHGLTQIDCALMANTTTATANDGSGLSSAWWWSGECRWVEATLRGETSYCANNSAVNRGLLTTVAAIFIVVPMWGFAAWRHWGTTVAETAAEEESREAADKIEREKERRRRQRAGSSSAANNSPNASDYLDDDPLRTKPTESSPLLQGE